MPLGGYQSAGLKRRQFARKVKWYVIISICVFIIVGFFYIFVFSGFFSVQRIEVIGAPDGQTDRILNVLRQQVVARRIGGILGADNYFSWSDSLLYEDIKSNRVSVEKDFWSRQIRVTVYPRARYGIWCIISSDPIPNCNWVDSTGVVFESASIPDGQIIIALYESATTTSAILGMPIIKPEYFKVIKQVAESLPKFQMPVSVITVDRALEEVQLQTISGTKVSFSLRFDPTISALPAFQKLISSSRFSEMRTVDFTVENRVFYTAK
ncbi:MAG: hypothetical protein Q7R62_03120 [bacterium]|nr:hypothetical protein [bacterium]